MGANSANNQLSLCRGALSVLVGGQGVTVLAVDAVFSKRPERVGGDGSPGRDGSISVEIRRGTSTKYDSVCCGLAGSWGFEAGKQVAFLLKEVLDALSLKSFVKTSGKTGLHIFVPIERTLTFDQARTVCELIGRHLMLQHPDLITMEWSTEKRTGKIFFDHNMNGRGKTLNVAYSPRGVTGAPVSMPVTWEELPDILPPDFRMDNTPRLMAAHGDAWRELHTTRQSLEAALKMTEAVG